MIQLKKKNSGQTIWTVHKSRWMAHKHVKKYSLLIFGEMQNKTTVKHHYEPITRLKLNTDNSKRWQEWEAT